MSDINYDELLNKVIDETSNVESTGERFKLPKAEIFYEGNRTVIKNFDKIASVINRDPDVILKFLLKSVGTAGEIEGSRVVFQGKIPAYHVQDKLKEYIENQVLCSECGRPDTHIVKKGRNTMLRCDACGAIRSVNAVKTRDFSKDEDKLEEGKVVEVTIKDIGKKGDGVAYYNRFTIFVNGAVKGSTVKVRVNKISGNIAFANVVRG
jgi:translation initiation factor 2 subunit 2